MVHYVAVHGTGSRDPEWAREHSPLREYLADLGWQPADHPLGNFSWSGEAGRILWLLNRHDWEAAASSLRAYTLALLPPINIISHSHGAQVVVKACALGLKVQTWIDISGPIRGDTLKIYHDAKPHIGCHVHVHDESRFGDFTKILGSLFDGALRIPLKHPEATVDVPLPDVGHSGVLTDPAKFHFWQDAILPAVQGV